MIVLIRLLDPPETSVTDNQSTPSRKPKIVHKPLLNNTLFMFTYGKEHNYWRVTLKINSAPIMHKNDGKNKKPAITSVTIILRDLG